MTVVEQQFRVLAYYVIKSIIGPSPQTLHTSICNMLHGYIVKLNYLCPRSLVILVALN